MNDAHFFRVDWLERSALLRSWERLILVTACWISVKYFRTEIRYMHYYTFVLGNVCIISTGVIGYLVFGFDTISSIVLIAVSIMAAIIVWLHFLFSFAAVDIFSDGWKMEM